MIVKCPNCMHSRSVLEEKIPPTAEYAKCPRCGHRFRFRTLETPKEQPVQDAADNSSGVISPVEQASPDHIAQIPHQPDTHGPISQSNINSRQISSASPLIQENNQPTPGPALGADELSAISQNSTKKSVKKTQPQDSIQVPPKNILEAAHLAQAEQKNVRTTPVQSSEILQTQETQQPQTKQEVQKNQKSGDIWDAVESLHQRWIKRSKSSPRDVEKAPDKSLALSIANVAPVLPKQDEETIHIENSEQEYHSVDSPVTRLPNAQRPEDFKAQADKNNSPQDSRQSSWPSAQAAQPNAHREQWQNLEDMEAEEESEDYSYNAKTPQDDSWEQSLATAPEYQPSEGQEAHALNDPDDFEDLGIQSAPQHNISTAERLPWRRPVVSPEQKVEQDLQLLIAKSDRKVRDLGVLMDTPENSEDEAHTEEVLELKKPQHLWLHDIWLNFSGTILFNSSSLRNRHPHAGMLPALLLAALQGYLLFLGINMWGTTLHTMLDFVPVKEAVSSITMQFLAPAMLLLCIFMAAGLFRVFSMLTGGRPPLGSALVKILCYATAPLTLGLLHPYALLAGTAWSVVAAGTACKRAFHKNTMGGIAMALLMGCAICILTLVLLTFSSPETIITE